jgi:hypothetical protein
MKYQGKAPLNNLYTLKKMKDRKVKQVLLGVGTSERWKGKWRG